MSMEWIRKSYDVPAKRGCRVIYTGDKVPVRGTIVGTSGSRLRIKIDGSNSSMIFHPTWEIRYLDGAEVKP